MEDWEVKYQMVNVAGVWKDLRQLNHELMIESLLGIVSGIIGLIMIVRYLVVGLILMVISGYFGIVALGTKSAKKAIKKASS